MPLEKFTFLKAIAFLARIFGFIGALLLGIYLFELAYPYVRLYLLILWMPLVIAMAALVIFGFIMGRVTKPTESRHVGGSKWH